MKKMKIAVAWFILVLTGLWVIMRPHKKYATVDRDVVRARQIRI